MADRRSSAMDGRHRWSERARPSRKSPMHPSPPGDGRAITPALLRSWPLPLPREGDKLVRGTVLVVGGSEETPGASMLAGLAARRSGAGKLQIATSPVVAAVVAAAVPEALVTGWPTLAGDPSSAWDPVD